MPNKKQFFLFLGTYGALRLFSYFFSPETPLHSAHPLNTAVAGVILLLTIYFLVKKDIRGWYIIAAEMILGGAGGFLAIAGISLRTVLLVASLTIYGLQKLKDCKKIIKENKIFCFFVFLFFCFLGFSALRGYYLGHSPRLIIADLIPYLFFLYYFPLKELLQKNLFPPQRDPARGGTIFKSLIFNLLLAALIGNFIFIILTFAGYSSGLLALQDSYYHWFRDVANGKITELGFNFYRIVLNEHLLLVPLLIVFIHRIIQNKKDYHLSFIIYLLLITTLSINLTRIYLVALAAGLLFLFSKTNWKRWLAVTFISCFLFLISFTTLHLIASRGQSLGWELFGLRLQSITAPKTEESSLSRLLLLPKIWGKIKTRPLLGNGLGDTVTVYSPIFKQEITTPHFDWGYLEVVAELGILGLLAWLFLISYLLLSFIRFSPSFTASIISLLAINLTSPALFHVLGVVWITFLLVLKNHKND